MDSGLQQPPAAAPVDSEPDPPERGAGAARDGLSPPSEPRGACRGPQPVQPRSTTSDQTRRPAEFKHITKRRKRN